MLSVCTLVGKSTWERTSVGNHWLALFLLVGFYKQIYEKQILSDNEVGNFGPRLANDSQACPSLFSHRIGQAGLPRGRNEHILTDTSSKRCDYFDEGA